MIWPRLKRGDRGDAVAALQRDLAKAYCSPGEIDGIFGALTERAVRKYQARFPNLRQTGIADLATLRMLASGNAVQVDETSAAREFCRARGVGGTMPSPMPGLLAALLVDAKSGVPARWAREVAPGDDVHEINAWVAWVALRFEERNIREETQNRGAYVDAIVSIGGGNPEKAGPWCAYFVACCRRVAVWLWCETTGEDSESFRFPTSGGAIRTWHKATERCEGYLVHDDDPPIGAAYHRTRTAAPVSEADEAAHGAARNGHTGIVVELDGEQLICVGGNSSGAGHSSSSRGGRVALEVLSESKRDNPQAYEAWRRVVGYTFVEVDE